jgi:hypothetical protein
MRGPTEIEANFDDMNVYSESGRASQKIKVEKRRLIEKWQCTVRHGRLAVHWWWLPDPGPLTQLVSLKRSEE